MFWLVPLSEMAADLAGDESRRTDEAAMIGIGRAILGVILHLPPADQRRGGRGHGQRNGDRVRVNRPSLAL